MVRITPEGVEVVVGRPSPYSTGGQSTSDTTIDTVDFEPEIGEIIEPATQTSLTEGSDAAQYIALSIDDARAGNFIDSNTIYYQYWDDLVFVYEGNGVYSIYHRGDDTSNPNNILGRTNQDGYNAIMGIQENTVSSETQLDAAQTTSGDPTQTPDLQEELAATSGTAIGSSSTTPNLQEDLATASGTAIGSSTGQAGAHQTTAASTITSDPTREYTEDFQSYEKARRQAAVAQAQRDAHDAESGGPRATSTVITSDPTREYTEDFQSHEKARRQAAEAQAQRDAHDAESGGPRATSTVITSDPTREYTEDFQSYEKTRRQAAEAAGPPSSPEDIQTGTLSDELADASGITYGRQTQQPPIGTITSTGVGSHTPEATIAPNPEAAFQEEFQTSILPRIENGELQFGGMDVFIPSTAEIEFNGYPAELSSYMGNYVVTYTDNQGTEISQVFSKEDGTLIRTTKKQK